MSKLYRSVTNRRLSGVCGGLAEYLGISAGFVRFIAVIAAFCSFGATLFVYFIASLLLPKQPVIASYYSY